jgi:hypothetical protein
MEAAVEMVKVVVRIRPLSSREVIEGCTRCIGADVEACSVYIGSEAESKTFTYDFVADEDITQEEVFCVVGKPIASCCLAGYNGTVFSYGQTGAGKTFSILGPAEYDSFKERMRLYNLRGLLPRSLEFLFSSIRQEMRSNEDIVFQVKVSFLEIYQETVLDLLSTHHLSLQLREDLRRGVYVEGLSVVEVSTLEEASELLREGIQRRHTAETGMNKDSSRSHSVFTLTIERRETTKEGTHIRTARFHMIDLAGSERQKATGAMAERLKESGMINKSLSTLGHVINALVEISEGKSRHVHYRDSKLTFLLKDSLGGNSKTCIIANVSPSSSAYGETLSTLKFAQRAKLIRNKAVINEDSLGSAEQLQQEVKRLKLLLNDKTPVYNDVPHSRILELEGLLAANMKLSQDTEVQLQNIIREKDEELSRWLDAVAKFEKKAASDKLIIKFRENTLDRLQQGQPEDVRALHEEAKLLRDLVESNPGMAKLFAENCQLKNYIATLSKEGSLDKSSLQQRLKASQDFTRQLQQALSHGVAERRELTAELNDARKYKAGTLVSTPVKIMHQQELRAFKDTVEELRERLEYGGFSRADTGILTSMESRGETDSYLQKVTEQQATLQTEYVRSKQKAEELCVQVTQLLHELKATSDTGAALKEENARLKQLLAERNELLTEVENQRDAADQRISELNCRSPPSDSIRDMLKDAARMSCLESELELCRSQVETLEGELSRALEEAETFQEENRFLRSRTKAEPDCNHARTIEELRAEAVEGRSLVISLQTRLGETEQALQSERVNCMKVQAILTQVRADHEVKIRQLNEAAKQRQDAKGVIFEAPIETLQGKEAEKKPLAQDDGEKENAGFPQEAVAVPMQKELMKLRHENEQLRRYTSVTKQDYEQVEREVHDLRAHLNDYQRMKSLYEEAWSASNLQRLELNASKDAINKLTYEYEAAEKQYLKEIARLQSQVTENEMVSQSYRARLCEAQAEEEAEVTTLRKRVEVLQEELSAMKEECCRKREDALNEVMRCRDTENLLSEECADLRSKLTTFVIENKALSLKVETLLGQAAEASAHQNIAQRIHMHTKLKEMLTAEKEENRVLKEDLRKKKLKLDSIEQKLLDVQRRQELEDSRDSSRGKAQLEQVRKDFSRIAQFVLGLSGVPCEGLDIAEGVITTVRDLHEELQRKIKELQHKDREIEDLNSDLRLSESERQLAMQRLELSSSPFQRRV